MSEEPVVSPLEETPPAETPPAETPPAETPPAETPPAETPPAETPPAEAPQDWRANLPDDLRDHEKVKSFGSVEELVRKVVDAPEPAEVPEAGNYKLKDGTPVIPELGKVLNEAGFTQNQVSTLMELRSGLDEAERSERVKVYTKGLKETLKGWGEDSDKNASLAKAALEQLDENGELTGFLKATGEAFNPIVVKFFHRVGKALDEHQLLRPGRTAETPKKVSTAELFYPSMSKKQANE